MGSKDDQRESNPKSSKQPAHLDTHNRYRKLVELLALKNDDRRKLQNNPPSGYV